MIGLEDGGETAMTFQELLSKQFGITTGNDQGEKQFQ